MAWLAELVAELVEHQDRKIGASSMGGLPKVSRRKPTGTLKVAQNIRPPPHESLPGRLHKESIIPPVKQNNRPLYSEVHHTRAM